MKRIGFSLILAVPLGMASLARAQVGEPPEAQPTEEKAKIKDPQALDILKSVDSAIKKVKSVQYSSKVEATGSMAARVGSAEGTVLVSAQAPGSNQRFRIQMKATLPNSQEVQDFTVGTDGTLFYLIDPAKKMVYADIDPAVAGNRRGLALGFQGLLMLEFFHPTPFDDELNADEIVLLDSQKAGDQECHVVRVVYSNRQGESIWFFSKKDFLPRRREIVVSDRATGEPGKVIRTLTDLIADPKVSDDAFKLVVPEGFEKTDDFAPDLPLGIQR